MQIIATALPEVLELVPKRFTDNRGHFTEVWNSKTLSDAGINMSFCQDNESYSRKQGTVRGLHCQTPPASQDKLVRVLNGSIFDVAVDIRKGSPTYRQWVGVELSADKGNQLLVPKGFLHGFITRTDNAAVAYKCTDFYAADCDRVVLWNDPEIAVQWGTDADQVTLSEKDQRACPLSGVDIPFKFGAVN